MSSRIAQRAIVAALLVAAVATAIAVHISLTQGLHERRANRLAVARHRVADALQRRTYFLEDLADMVGVHDDAAAAEFSRYAHVRGREERAVVSVEWVRRSTSGGLVPAAAPDPNPGPTPVLIAPASAADGALADGAHEHAASHAIALASLSKTVSVSAPVKLANGHPAFYLAVPIEARRYSGALSKLESQSAIVGLVDVHVLVEQALGGGSPAFRLRDGVTPLAAVGSGLHNAVQAAVPAAGRRWTVAVEGGTLSSIQVAAPWLVLLIGLGLTAAVATILRNSARRRDEALRLADERLADLAVSLQRVEAANNELEVARAQAEMRSRVDALTEIFNRRHFGEMLDKELSRPDGPRAAVLLLDVDHFKRINDEHGHLTGDVILQAVAARIGSTVRSTDCLARWGGEEFAILASDMNDESTQELAERARRAVSDEPVVVDGVPLSLRVSIGAALSGDGLDSPDEILDAADQALYEAKRTGRDRVRLYSARAGAERA
ncbi:MAG: two-component system, cell cycle response regulator [Solirubrobacteraceae bacterium]|nr:two-component system, cell cycle response regulator [Solirubrobacteraceae bacterium]